MRSTVALSSKLGRRRCDASDGDNGRLDVAT